jgi:hypothetical protein
MRWTREGCGDRSDVERWWQSMAPRRAGVRDLGINSSYIYIYIYTCVYEQINKKLIYILFIILHLYIKFQVKIYYSLYITENRKF